MTDTVALTSFRGGYRNEIQIMKCIVNFFFILRHPGNSLYAAPLAPRNDIGLNQNTVRDRSECRANCARGSVECRWNWTLDQIETLADATPLWPNQLNRYPFVSSGGIA